MGDPAPTSADGPSLLPTPLTFEDVLSAAEQQRAEVIANLTAAHRAAELQAHAGHHHLQRREASFVLWSTIAALVLSQVALTRLKAAGHRVVLFSQFTMMLDVRHFRLVLPTYLILFC